MNILTQQILVVSPALRARRGRRAGFSLPEAMTGMFVFALLAVGFTATTLQARKISQMNILRNTAFTIAQGYVEQIKSINAVEVSDARDTSKSLPLPTKSVSAITTGSNIEREDPLYVHSVASPPTGITLEARDDDSGDVWNRKQVLVDLNGTKQIVMTMWVDVDVWDSTNTSPALPAGTFVVVLDFEFRSDGYLAGGRRRGHIRMVRTDINGG